MKNVRTVLFEDSEIEVRGIKELVKGVPGVLVIGVFDTVKEALFQCSKLKPDLILSDADIRGDKTVGPIFVKEVRKILPDVKILGLTRYPECIKPMKAAGCDEVVLKQFFENEEAAYKYINEALLERSNFDNQLISPSLTDEEDRVLRLIANGYTENEISIKIHKTRKQVRNIKRQLKDKFGANRDPQLIHHAYRYGYLNLNDD